MLIIPINPIPNQTLEVLLSGQDCKIRLRQKDVGLFLDLQIDNRPVFSSVICHNRCRIARYPYRQFKGALMLFDTTGDDDPYYTGLGNRFVLCHLEEGEQCQTQLFPFWKRFGGE